MGGAVVIRRPSRGILEEVDLEGLKVTVFKTALELGIIEVLWAGASNHEAVASAAGCDPKGIRVLLEALVLMKLVDRAEDKFKLTELAEKYLVASNPGYCAPIYLDWLRSRENLSNVIRTGRASTDHASPANAGLWAAHYAPDLIEWPAIIDQLTARWHDLGLSPTTLPGARVLDIGCGSGLTSLAIAYADARATVVAVDRPEVLNITRKLAQSMGVIDRIEFREGDAFKVDFEPAAFDAVLFGNILHFLSPMSAGELLRKAFDALKPGGRIFVSASMRADDGQLGAEVWNAVEMLSVSPQGSMYTFSEYGQLIEAAGFVDPVRYGVTMLIAYKR
jgi:C-methyltransferase